jgi:hypothetical protein
MYTWELSTTTFNDDYNLKAQLVARAKQHRAQDDYVQGSYGNFDYNRFRGCAVGCSLYDMNDVLGISFDYSDHAAYEYIGIPRVIARLQDGIFERLPNHEAKNWPVQFWEAMPVGVDLRYVWQRFVVAMLTDSQHGVIRYARDKEAVQHVANLYQRYIDGDQPSNSEWRADADAAAAADARIWQRDTLLKILSEAA